MKKIIPGIFIVLFLPVSLFSQDNTPSQINSAKTKAALVIGNSRYPTTTLLTPENDARSMKKILEVLGFEVLEYENVSQSLMKEVIDEFGIKLKNYEVGLFFYAGHAIQVKGFNYLIPVETDLKTESEVELSCVKADRVLMSMNESGAKLKIVILDACRISPFKQNWTGTSIERGLALMKAPAGTLIAFSSIPGRIVTENRGNNSLYTSAILKSIVCPDISILQMFQNVRTVVMQKTSRVQIPWESADITENYFFNKNSDLTTKYFTSNKILPGESLKQEFNMDSTDYTTPASSYKNIRIKKITKTETVNNRTILYVILDKGLNFRIKPKDHLRLFSPIFEKSAITGENRIKNMRKIGHIVILNSDPDLSEGKIEFDNGIDVINEFNQELSYAIK